MYAVNGMCYSMCTKTRRVEGCKEAAKAFSTVFSMSRPIWVFFVCSITQIPRPISIDAQMAYGNCGLIFIFGLKWRGRMDHGIEMVISFFYSIADVILDKMVGWTTDFRDAFE